MTQQGNPRYLHLLKYLAYLHIVKAYGYGTQDDPLNNLRASARLGIPPWKGAYVRAEDKLNRVINLTTRDSVPSVGERENVLDTMADRMAYDGLALVLFSEESMSDAEFQTAFATEPLPGETQFDIDWTMMSVEEVAAFLRQWLDANSVLDEPWGTLAEKLREWVELYENQSKLISYAKLT